MGVGAAAAGIGAAASIGGSLLSSGAASDAADKQAGAANRAADLQLQEQERVRADLAPFRTTGVDATNKLASFFGLGSDPTSGVTANAPVYLPGTGTNGTPLQYSSNELRALEATPGYQFALTQGLKSTQNSAAARGLGTSGAALKGAAGFATGLAQNTYQQNLLNPLQYLAGQGESAAAQTGTLGTQGAANAGAGIVGAGNAQAAGAVGSANALSGGLSSAAGAPLNYLLYNKLLGGGGAGSGGGDFYSAPAYGGVDPALASINPASGGIY